MLLRLHKPVFHLPWLPLCAAWLSLGWLLPVHTDPWRAFQNDAWMALAFGAAALWLLLRVRGPCAIPKEVAALLALAVVPLFQFALGQVNFAGTMWMSVAYLCGLACVVWVGARWEAHAPDQMLDLLFIAIGIAAFATVLLQVQQYFGLVDDSQWWALNVGASRPSGNLGQPNHAATLLCWGLCATGWGMARGQVRPPIALLSAAALLGGVALTESRTAAVGLVLAAGFVVAFRRLWAGAAWRRALLALMVYYLACLWWVVHSAGGGALELISRSGSTHQRWQALAVFTDAVAQHPWSGYGWNQSFLAQIAVADAHPGLDSRFSSSHNLLLDVLVWCGLPLGLLTVAGLVWWLGGLLSRLRTPGQFTAALLLMFAVNHAMFEYPLYYAYFLLPFGCVAGALGVKLARTKALVSAIGAKWVALLFALPMLLLAGILTDYAAMDSFRINRWDMDANGSSAKVQVPNLTFLTDQEAILRWGSTHRTPSRSTDAQLQQLQRVIGVEPEGTSIVFFASNLALNGQADNAQWWLRRACKLVQPEDCKSLKKYWVEAGATHPEIAALAWPGDEAATGQ